MQNRDASYQQAVKWLAERDTKLQSKGVTLLGQLALEKYPDAISLLLKMSDQCKDTDPEHAAYLCELAARSNSTNALIILAKFYSKGIGVGSDPDKLKVCLITLAKQGLTNAMYNLGVIYHDEKDPHQSTYWFEQGAHKGHAASQYQLSQIYAATDKQAAQYWLNKSAENGLALAIKNLNPSSNTITIQKIQINTLLLAIRYKDSLPLLKDAFDPSNKEKAAFRAQAKTYLLRYGSNHAGYGMGLFIDAYQREPADQSETANVGAGSQRHSTLFDRFIKLTNTSPANNIIHYPLVSSPTTKKLINTLFTPLTSNTVMIADRPYEILATKERLATLFGHLGLYPPTDSQSWAVANTGNFEALFQKLFTEINPSVTNLENYIADLPYEPLPLSAAQIQTRLLEEISSSLANEKNAQSMYYLQLLDALVRSIKIPDAFIDTEQQEQCRLAFSRMQFILTKALMNKDSQKEIFLIHLDFAFDEINFIRSLCATYTKEMMKTLITEFFEKNYGLVEPSEKKSLVAPVLAGSGMGLINLLLAKSLEEIRQHNDFDTGKIYINTGSYFEIPYALSVQLLLRTSIPIGSEMCITFGKESLVEKYNPAQLVDLIICSFQENIDPRNPDKMSFHAKDIDKLIKDQLMHRAETQSKKRLIVIIDTTMNSLDDSYMNSLLINYEKQIHSGQLAITTAHSLNKYFHMGFDKLPAGLGTLFFNKDAYPHLTEFADNDWMMGFTETDSTPQMLTHLIKHVPDAILQYQNIIKANSRFVHEVLIPKELIANNNKFMFFSAPYTDDIYKDVWGFMALNVGNKTIDPLVTQTLSNWVFQIATLSEIKARDGYGYNKTKIGFILAPDKTVVRFTIGTESQAELTVLLKPIVNFVLEMNKIVDLYAADMPQKCYDEMNKLAKAYLKNADKMARLKTTIPSSIYAHYFSAAVPSGPVNENPNLLVEAKDGNTDSQYLLAHYFMRKNNFTEAAKWFEIAARSGHLSALHAMAQCYENGMGVPQDRAKAFSLYKKAANNGHSDSLYELARLYEEGNNVAKDAVRAVKLYHNADALYYDERAFAHQISSVEDNSEEPYTILHHAKASFALGRCYEMGIGVAVNKEKSLEYYHYAAAAGHTEANYHLGILMENNQLSQAIEYFQVAAEQGHVNAQFRLGCLFSGKINSEITVDLVEAVKYFQLAANNEHAQAQWYLGDCYKQGLGIEKNIKAANKWYEAAIGNGYVHKGVVANTSLFTSLAPAKNNIIDNFPEINRINKRVNRK